MGDKPRELLQAQADYTDTADNYYKFFWDSDFTKTIKNKLKIYNKVGLSGGFLSDVSYFEDQENDIYFFLSAAIYAKKDGITNNGVYNYYDFGIPVLRKIGTLIYRHELDLKKDHK